MEFTLNSSPSGAALLARVLARTDCANREAALVEMLNAIPEALAVIRGRQRAAEHMYAAADAFATGGRAA